MSFGQGGPSWDSSGAPGQGPHGTRTPDWGALADASESRARRKRWLMIGGGGLATVAIAAIVATAVVSANSGDDGSGGKDTGALPPASALPSEPTEAEPSFPSASALPPPNPKDYISSADKDKAPLSAGTLFPSAALALNGHTYAKGATSSTTACAAAAQGRLGAVLSSDGCGQVIRATFHKDGVAVTVGVAVFEKEAQALKAKNEAKDGIASLPGAGVPTFCRAPSICRKTTNSYGRYVYFTVGGFTSGKNVTVKDKNVFTAGDDVAEFTFRQILARGQAQASAAATAPVN
ncbi:hypothetical protein [Streptomyces sp. NPDC088725]|uniref:hypothetical protein n=1 Tax=Streptomyces sp. NPDC088725 TaxID=3365873 RepID=UPI0037F1538A